MFVNTLDLQRLSSIIIILFFFIIYSAGCSIGPDYQEPNLLLPDNFATSEFSSENSDVAKWWEAFEDKELSSLINRGVEGNKTIDQAISRINQSRAIARQAFSQLLPGAQLQTNYQSSKVSGSRFPGDDKKGFNYEVYSGGIDAVWEIDIFGRLRRSLEAKNAEYAATVAELQDVVRIVISEIGTTYFSLRGSQKALTIANSNVGIQEETLRIAVTKFDSGMMSSLDTERARSQLEATRAIIPGLRAQVKSKIHRLSVLLGQSPNSLAEELAKAEANIPLYKGPIVIGHPVEMLRRRPDLKAAERQLAANTALVGVAVGDLYPKISITGSVAVEAPSPKAWSVNDSGIYSIMPTITWSAFDTGRLRARINASEAKVDESLAAYEQAVLLALEDVENALALFSAEKQRHERLVEAVMASKTAYQLAKNQYQEGTIDLLTVLDAQRTSLENESNLVNSELTLATSLVAIYKALGGGWQAWDFVPVEG